MGQRYLGCGLSSVDLKIRGVPGNALGRLSGRSGDHRLRKRPGFHRGHHERGNDLYSRFLRGILRATPCAAGKIFIKGNAGYRAGIHMKSYRDKSPVLVIGGCAGSFLGEYQAGGRIVVLGLSGDTNCPAGYFCGTGMHGGKIYLRCRELPASLPDQVHAKPATEDDLREIEPEIEQFCREFGFAKRGILDHSVLHTDSQYQKPLPAAICSLLARWLPGIFSRKSARFQTNQALNVPSELHRKPCLRCCPFCHYG